MAASVDRKLLRQTKFPPEFNQKVDIQKINVEVMKKWIAGKITEILKSDDDIVIELCFGLFEGSRFPDIKSLQISLTGFLDKDAPKFCKELWNLCLSAQSSPRGVPKELLEAKKLELLQEKEIWSRTLSARFRLIDLRRDEGPQAFGGRRHDEKLTVTSHAAVAEAGLMVEADLPLDLCPNHAPPLADDGALGYLHRGLDQLLLAVREEREADRGALQRVRVLHRPDNEPDECHARGLQVEAEHRRGQGGNDASRRGGRRHRSPSSLSADRRGKRADIVRSRPKRDARRLSRSPDNVQDRRRRRSSRSGSRSGSGTPDRREKRRRSLQSNHLLFIVHHFYLIHYIVSFATPPPAAVSPFSTPSCRSLSPARPHHVFQFKTSQSGGNEEDSSQMYDKNKAGSSGPPPGFNIEEAKKPLPKDEPKDDAKAGAPPAATESNKSDEQLQSSKTSAAAATATTITAKSAEDAKLTDVAVEKRAKTGPTEGKEHELDHYWQGTKLLAAEVKISMKLALKMAAGYELSRREHRQLQRTVQDLGRLVPFSVFVIVPFAELLLPVALSLFPNLLPSTYESQSSREAKATRLRETRKGVSTFLRNTLRETSFPVSSKSAKKEEFLEFFRKVRATGESPTREDVIKVCKIFKDDLTLDNLSRPQLVGMCKYMNLNSFGTDAWLRYQIRHRMRQIKRDDKAISFEGVDSLSVPELQMACAARGIRTWGMSPARLREDLQLWLDLRLKYNIPSTLLVLSNAFMYTSGKDSEINSQIEALQAVLSAIPEELFHEMELEVHNAEGAATNKQRLEVLKEQQELIEEENKQAASSKNEDGVAVGEDVKDDKDIDEKPAPKTEKEAMTGEDAVAKEAAEAEHDEEAVAAAQVKKD
ncbi:hypothetical protein DV736_g191, partial [Chaetothyriales sp. CBS 134916]